MFRNGIVDPGYDGVMERRRGLSQHLSYSRICLAAVMLVCRAPTAHCYEGLLPIVTVKSLTADEADRGRLVRIQGVVTLIWRAEEAPSQTHLVVRHG